MNPGSRNIFKTQNKQTIQQVHGGDWAAFEARCGRKPLDFSASIAPVPMPEAARQAVIDALKDTDRYPDPEQRELRSRLAEGWLLQEDEILCGNGAADLIHRLASAVRPTQCLITAPTFGEYRLALLRFGSSVREYTLREDQDFALTEEFLEALTPDIEMVILCEPGNPTGKCTDFALLEKIAEKCKQQGILLVVDESFHDFLDPKQHPSTLNLLSDDPVLVLRSFTKFYAMAGLRLGWCASRDKELLKRMRLEGQPWSVNTYAMRAGIAALGEKEYPGQLRKMIRAEREFLQNELLALRLRVIFSETNYFLFYDDLPGLIQKLENRGIMIRDCSSFSGLKAGWYRIAVRSREENQKLIEAMKEVHNCREIS